MVFYKAILRAFMSLQLVGTVSAASLSGDWHGTLVTPVQSFRIALRFTSTADGGGGYFESPDQSDRVVAIQHVVTKMSSLEFSVPELAGDYSGEWDAERMQWRGVWRQPDGRTALLTFSKGLLPPMSAMPELDGIWRGFVRINGNDIALIFRVFTTRHGTSAILDIPDQMRRGIPVSRIERRGAELKFTLDAIQSELSGEFDSLNGTLKGYWSERSGIVPVMMTRKIGGVATPEARPQSPRSPLPYKQHLVNFKSAEAGVSLAGTLTVPSGEESVPVAILIAGSGRNDRDATANGHKPFLVLADYLARRGVAVLRYDDRGYSAPNNAGPMATIEQRVLDVQGAIGYLRSTRLIDPERVSLIAHSEGGLVAATVATKDRRICSLVLLAPPAIGGVEAVISQQRLIGKAAGLSTTFVKRNVVFLRKLIDVVRNAEDQRSAERAGLELFSSAPVAFMSPPDRDRLLAHLTSDPMRSVLNFDLVANFQSIAVPTLAMYGSKDIQVEAESNSSALHSLNRDIVIRQMEGLNHMFQTANTGHLSEYGEIDETMSPVVLSAISTWVLNGRLGGVGR